MNGRAWLAEAFCGLTLPQTPLGVALGIEAVIALILVTVILEVPLEQESVVSLSFNHS